jgi:hypothetical protein
MCSTPRRCLFPQIEAFVHGAMCVSYSGQCFSSEAWGGRSANRGQCAQACRLPYGLLVNGVLKELADIQFLLSPQDLMGLSQVTAQPSVIRRITAHKWIILRTHSNFIHLRPGRIFSDSDLMDYVLIVADVRHMCEVDIS